MLQTFPSDKIKATKNALIFIFQPPAHHSFTFSLQFLYIAKAQASRFVSLKLCVGFSIFDPASSLLKLIFLLNKMYGLFDFKTS